jgi:hypothetical protein
MARQAEPANTMGHTPVAKFIAAEVGVWTDSDSGGQGRAAASAAEWAALMRPADRLRFYSNIAGLMVYSAHLGLRRIGTAASRPIREDRTPAGSISVSELDRPPLLGRGFRAPAPIRTGRNGGCHGWRTHLPHLPSCALSPSGRRSSSAANGPTSTSRGALTPLQPAGLVV